MPSHKHVTSAGIIITITCHVVRHSYEDAKALVTIGEGKHYSLGLDLDRMATMSGLGSFDFLYKVQALLARLLTFPLVTVAAMNGEI